MRYASLRAWSLIERLIGGCTHTSVSARIVRYRSSWTKASSRPHRVRSPWGVVMIKKPDGTYRLSVDFRKLNAVTEKESYPLPKLEETLGKLSENKYYSTLDMSRGTWQIPLSEESKEHTAFVTHRGQYHWNYLPAGLCNGRATFQRLMSKVLANVAQSYGNVVLSYTNDIMIASRTEEQHLEQLEAVLRACRNANLKLKALKCHLFEKEMRFMGRVITPEGVKPDPDNVEDIVKWKPPTDKKELAGFLDFASYYREFIKGYAEIASPLQSMKKLNVEFTWGEEQQEAFERLKQALVEPPVLATARPGWVLRVGHGRKRCGDSWHTPPVATFPGEEETSTASHRLCKS